MAEFSWLWFFAGMGMALVLSFLFSLALFLSVILRERKQTHDAIRDLLRDTEKVN